MPDRRGVTRGARGLGVEELIERILGDDLRSVVDARHREAIEERYTLPE